MEKEKASKEDGWHVGRTSIEEIRLRIKDKLGVDPYEVARIDRRERYLEQACGSLPPKDDPDRDKLRHGISLTAWFAMYDQQQETST
jgi:hypothetical protein